MNYCEKCGKEIGEGQRMCLDCQRNEPNKVSGLKLAAKVLMIVGTVLEGIAIFPLAWCIPMTVSYCRKIRAGIPVSTGFGVCTLLFVSLAAGIVMLCDKN